MKGKITTVLRYGISGLLTLVFLYIAFKGIDVDRFLSSLAKAQYLWLLAMIPILLLSNLFRAWRWKLMMEHLKGDLSIRNAFSAVMIGYMVNGLVPRAGELVRPYVIGQLENMSKSSALATIVVERVVDVLTLLLVSAISLLWFGSTLTSNFPWFASTALLAAVVILVAFAFFVLAVFRREWMFRLLQGITTFLPAKVSAAMERVLQSFLKGFLVIKNPRRYLAILLLSGAIWFCYVAMLYVAFYSFDLVQHRSLNFMSATVLNVVSTIGFILPTPGGTGTYHTFCRETLTRLFGVDYETAIAYATATHAVNYLVLFIGGLGFFFYDNLKLSEVMKASVS
jgi:uncharacterized protein (TIRG00374 family)